MLSVRQHPCAAWSATNADGTPLGSGGRGRKSRRASAMPPVAQLRAPDVVSSETRRRGPRRALAILANACGGRGRNWRSEVRCLPGAVTPVSLRKCLTRPRRRDCNGPKSIVPHVNHLAGDCPKEIPRRYYLRCNRPDARTPSLLVAWMSLRNTRRRYQHARREDFGRRVCGPVE